MKPLNSGIQWLLSFYVMISGIAFCAQGYRKQTGNWKLKTANWKLQAASCELTPKHTNRYHIMNIPF